MPHLFIILLKINLVLLLFAATYYLILRRLTFYVLNRCFLVFGIVFSTAYPFIDLTEFFDKQEVVAYLPQLNQKASELVPTGFFINNWPYLSALFYLGVLVMTVRLAIQFISLYRIHRKSSPSTVANYNVRTLNESVSPFSFWQTIYVNPSLHNEKELDTILAHETVHVKQWHSVDIILAELSVVFYWFNPGVWLMKKAVKENLEFITDQKILKKGMDRKAYQYSLLGVGQLNTSVPIVNNFNLSDLKKRIKMMNVKRSSKLTLSRYALALPVLLLTTLAFTISKKEVKAHLPQLAKIIPHLTVDEEVKPEEKVVVTARKKEKIVKNKIKEEPVKKDTLYRINHIVSTLFFDRDTNASGRPSLSEIKEMMAAVTEKLGLPRTQKPIVNGKISQVFVYKKDSTIAGAMGESPKVSIKFKSIGKVEEVDLPIPNGEKMIIVRGFKKTADSVSLDDVKMIVNGKAYPSKELSNINPNEIQHVQVIKGEGKKSQIHVELKKRAEL
ncbi:MAG: M56 family metallopeptidase [Pedobacter sp.]|nr:M56 family metallopeptidase [Pedobacter sp.]